MAWVMNERKKRGGRGSASRLFSPHTNSQLIRGKKENASPQWKGKPVEVGDHKKPETREKVPKIHFSWGFVTLWWGQG